VIYTRTAADAGTELGEPAHGGPPQRTVWYRITPAASSRFTLEATSPDVAPVVVAVYAGRRLDALARLTSGTASSVRFLARRGQTYHVAVDVPAGASGDFTLDVSDGSLAAKGVTVAVTAGQTVESVRSRGLRLLVGTRREARVDLELRVSRATARALGLRSQVLGRARGRLEPAQKLPAAIELSTAARRALLNEPGLRATLRVSLQSSSAPDRTRDIPIRLAA
jgi:hypothetical protein